MPTGYTAGVANGSVTDFRAFALQCARAFGALVMMRDDPMDAPIPNEFKASDYHAFNLAKARTRIVEVQAYTLDQCEDAARREWEQECQRREEAIARSDKERRRFEAMLIRVHAWTPPTPDHVGLRDFMVQQLTSSIEHDCGPIDRWWPVPQRLSATSWRIATLAKLKRDIEYDEKGQREENERTQERNTWVGTLRASLARPDSAGEKL